MLCRNDKGRLVLFNVTQTMGPELLVGSEFRFDWRKDKHTIRLRAEHALSGSEVVGGSVGSDGILVGSYEWRTSAHLKTRIKAQMDVRHYDSDAHHLGVSIEIS